MNISIDLVPYENDGLEFLVDKITGEMFATISAVGRIVERNESTIRRFLTSRKIELKLAQVQTVTGFKTSRILGEELIFEVCQKYKPQLLWLFARIGLRMYLQGLAGYGAEQSGTKIEKLQSSIPPVYANNEDLSSANFDQMVQECKELRNSCLLMWKQVSDAVIIDLSQLTLLVEQFGMKIEKLQLLIPNSPISALSVGVASAFAEAELSTSVCEQLNLRLEPEAEDLGSNAEDVMPKYTVMGRIKERGLERIGAAVGRIGARARELYVGEMGKHVDQERMYVRCAKFATYVYVGDELRFVDLAIDERLMKLGLYADLMSSSLIKV